MKLITLALICLLCIQLSTSIQISKRKHNSSHHHQHQVNHTQQAGQSHTQLHPIHKRFMTVSGKCQNNGYYFVDRCYCLEGYKGKTCSEKGFLGWDDNEASKCDDLTARLDHLYNLAPGVKSFDDVEFQRLRGDSIGKGDAAYGEKGNTWIRMHDVTKQFEVFAPGVKMSAKDIGQGALGNCYFLAAIASLANIRDGEIIRDAFQTKEDNDERFYTARFLIDGKPRMISVDEWVPGSGSRPSFTQITNNNQFYVMILEKMWAKAHGNYMATQGGWQTNVWRAITQAPIGQVFHDQETDDSIFTMLKQNLAKGFACGAGSVKNERKDLVQGHAYAVLGAYEFKDGGKTVKLIRVYNPWANEKTYAKNPWGDNSSKWTAAAKKAVNFEEHGAADDGLFHLSHDDFFKQFGLINYCEIYQGYGSHFQQIPLQRASSEQAMSTYTAKFTYSGSTSKPFFISLELIDPRLLQGCTEGFKLRRFTVKTPAGKTIQAAQEGWEQVFTARVEGANVAAGEYEVDVKLQGDNKFHHFFTISAYAQQGKINFAQRAKDDTYVEKFTKRCPNDCSGHGICNTFTGMCQCEYAYSKKDCSVHTPGKCPDNCNGNGVCQDDNTCYCNKGFNEANCVECSDKAGKRQCDAWKADGKFDEPQYGKFLSENCAKSFGAGTC